MPARRYTTRPRPPSLARQAGASLIELIVTMVIMAIVLTGIAVVFFATVKQTPEPVIDTRAAELGQAYLDEILTKRYDAHAGEGGIPRCNSTDPGATPCSTTLGPEPGETRATYDDVDDYNGLDESPPRGAQGAVLPGYAGYRVQISVVYAGTGLGLASNQDAKRITVTITSPLGTHLVFSAYRVNY